MQDPAAAVCEARLCGGGFDDDLPFRGIAHNHGAAGISGAGGSAAGAGAGDGGGFSAAGDAAPGAAPLGVSVVAGGGGTNSVW